jgi:hypothetical protein
MRRSITAIFCDDVRQELNGKYILIGAYAGVMTVPSFPFFSRLVAVVTIDAPLSEVRRVTGRFVARAGGAEFGTGSFDLESPPDPNQSPLQTYVVFPPVMAPFSGEEILDLWVGVNDEDPVLGGSIKIVRVPPGAGE